MSYVLIIHMQGIFQGIADRAFRFLVLAATDTTSSSMTQIMELLALHPDVQEKLRDEIMQARQESDGDIPYDRLASLPYMDAVCRETLRL